MPRGLDAGWSKPERGGSEPMNLAVERTRPGVGGSTKERGTWRKKIFLSFQCLLDPRWTEGDGVSGSGLTGRPQAVMAAVSTASASLQSPRVLAGFGRLGAAPRILRRRDRGCGAWCHRDE